MDQSGQNNSRSLEKFLNYLVGSNEAPEGPASLPSVSLIGEFVLATITVMLFWLGLFHHR
jgi:hypothetical protein